MLSPSLLLLQRHLAHNRAQKSAVNAELASLPLPLSVYFYVLGRYAGYPSIARWPYVVGAQ